VFFYSYNFALTVQMAATESLASLSLIGGIARLRPEPYPADEPHEALVVLLARMLESREEWRASTRRELGELQDSIRGLRATVAERAVRNGERVSTRAPPVRRAVPARGVSATRSSTLHERMRLAKAHLDVDTSLAPRANRESFVYSQAVRSGSAAGRYSARASDWPDGSSGGQSAHGPHARPRPDADPDSRLRASLESTPIDDRDARQVDGARGDGHGVAGGSGAGDSIRADSIRAELRYAQEEADRLRAEVATLRREKEERHRAASLAALSAVTSRPDELDSPSRQLAEVGPGQGDGPVHPGHQGQRSAHEPAVEGTAQLEAAESVLEELPPGGVTPLSATRLPRRDRAEVESLSERQKQRTHRRHKPADELSSLTSVNSASCASTPHSVNSEDFATDGSAEHAAAATNDAESGVSSFRGAHPKAAPLPTIPSFSALAQRSDPEIRHLQKQGRYAPPASSSSAFTATASSSAVFFEEGRRAEPGGMTVSDTGGEGGGSSSRDAQNLHAETEGRMAFDTGGKGGGRRTHDGGWCSGESEDDTGGEDDGRRARDGRAAAVEEVEAAEAESEGADGEVAGGVSAGRDPPLERPGLKLAGPCVPGSSLRLCGLPDSSVRRVAYYNYCYYHHHYSSLFINKLFFY